ncbi:hypothetical protein HPP92_005557 [Vanilla planifolia]|uniref:RRM domain-containing protein n=1 Tax=Vanilla planifolia TaxID=51239 RepID=A0A835RPX5_VANPL|nr:hypothetical protein HPP92_005557 [Vanilla planifolia]
MLQETFRSHYTSVKGAKIVTDRITGRSKGYGFVRFGDANEQARAMTEMNGVFCSTRPMRVGPAANKKTTDALEQDTSKASYQSAQGNQSESDPNNTTIFVGGLDPNVTEDVLRQVFSPYGELVHVEDTCWKTLWICSVCEQGLCRGSFTDVAGNPAWCPENSPFMGPKPYKQAASARPKPMEW